MRAYHQIPLRHKCRLTLLRSLDLEPDLAGELELLSHLLPDRLIPRPIELLIIAGGAE